MIVQPAHPVTIGARITSSIAIIQAVTRASAIMTALNPGVRAAVTTAGVLTAAVSAVAVTVAALAVVGFAARRGYEGSGFGVEDVGLLPRFRVQ